MYYLIGLKISTVLSLFESYNKLQEEWDYIEDPTYSRSLGSHVCMTCEKFDYSCQSSRGSILCCNLHKKLIWHGQHLTHSCELYKNKSTIGTEKKLINHLKPNENH